MGVEKKLIRHISKVRDKIDLQKIEEKDKQFLIEKIIAKVENKSPCAIETTRTINYDINLNKKKKKKRICRHAYQILFYEIAETYIKYINTLTADETEQLDTDLRSNDWRVKSIVEIEDCIELMRLFQLFYYPNGRLSLSNGLLPTPDGETPDGSEKYL